MKQRKWFIFILLFYIFSLCNIVIIEAKEQSSIITTKEYVIGLSKILQHSKKETEKKMITVTKDIYLDYAILHGLLMKTEVKDLSKKLTRANAAVYANRADEILYGKTFDKALYEQVKEKKRITGLNSIDAATLVAIRKVFLKGIMVGDFNGLFTQSRNFNTTKLVTEAEANSILDCIRIKTKRRKLSPDGQVIRTTNLPKNYKSYPYILEAYPNRFYEMKCIYQYTTYSYKPVELKDYASAKRIKDETWIASGAGWRQEYPAKDIIEKNIDTWCKVVEENLKLRFSFDYRTSGIKWINDLRNTYMSSGSISFDKRTTEWIEEYVERARKNKVILKVEKVVVEPSTLYDAIGYYLRAYVRFKILSANEIPTYESSKQHKNLILGEYVGLVDLKKGISLEGVYDIQLGTMSFSSMGEDYKVTLDALNDYPYKLDK